MKKIEITAFDIAQRFLGIKEISGNMANSQITAMLQLEDKSIQSDEVPWCFTGEVEILTECGFMRFDSLSEGLMVAQVDPFLEVSYALPTRYIHHHHDGELITMESRDFGLTCDPEHKFFGIWNRQNALAGPLELRPIKDLTSSLFIPSVMTGISEDDTNWPDRDIALLAAFLSDGFMRSRNHDRIAIQVSKIRKLDALAALEPIHVYKAKRTYGMSTIPLTTFEYYIPKSFKAAFGDYKTPKWEILHSWSKRQLAYFLEAYVVFDGHIRGGSRSLYTSMLGLRDWLQAAATLAGFHTSYRISSKSRFSGNPCWEVVFCPKKRTRTLRPSAMHSHNGRIELYCVEVPSGIIIIRDPKGTVIPVGNCSAFVNYIAWLLGLPRSKSLSARSWLTVGTPVTIDEAEIGFDVVVFKRGTGNQPGADVIDAPGHVGFYAGHEGNLIIVLGGNQGDAVSLARFKAENLLGIRRLI